jgi:hypothetical protein
MHCYYYNATTGEFTMRTSKPYAFTTDPYILRPQGWNYSSYRVNLTSGEPELKA